MQADEEFFLSLNSNSPLAYTGSNPGNFRIKLKNILDLSDGKWKVAIKNFKFRRGIIAKIDRNKRVLPNNSNSKASIEVYHVNTYPSPVKLDDVHDDIHADINCKADDFQNEIKEELELRFRAKHPEFNGTLRVTLTCIDLEPNYYETPEDIAYDIIDHFITARNSVKSKNMKLHYEYDNNTRRVIFFGADALVFKNSNHLIKAMGLQSGEAREDTSNGIIDDSYWKFIGVVNGVNGIMTDSYEIIHVLSSMVNFSRVNSESIQVLGFIPARMIDNQRIDYVPNNPEYFRVKDKIINDIEIRLSTSDMKIIKLDKGELQLILHFKKYLSL